MKKKYGGNKNIDPHGGVKFEKGNKDAEKWTEKRALSFGQEILDWMTSADENIFFDEFVYLIAPKLPNYQDVKISADTPNYLGRKFLSFSELFDNARKIQELKLKKFGVFDKLNASMTKFVLINNHKWTERTESDVRVTDTNFSIKDIYKDEWDDEGEETQ